MKIKQSAVRWKKKLVLLYTRIFCQVDDSSNREIQDVFDLMIKTGLYGETHLRMCDALFRAKSLNIISHREQSYYTSDIMLYLYSINHSVYMTEALRNLGILPHTNDMNAKPEYSFKERIHKYCLPVYQDWKNRPTRSDLDAK